MNDKVDGNDFLIWQRQLGAPAAPRGSGADGNIDGTVDALDLDVWREQFGGPAMLVASARNALAAVVEAERDGVATPVVDAAFAALARADFSLGDRTATPRRPAWRAALRVPWEQMWASMINARGSAAADPPSRC
ncbi:MAG TPA: hypothetical protein PKC18_08285, partial [Lacipirellulaceae bacterium]|nr:hypothetical protein [Lacipirellulaceae bacterium]